VEEFGGMRSLKTVLLVVSLLFFVQEGRSQTQEASLPTQTPYSRSFPLELAGVKLGELVISFEDVINVGDFSVTLSSLSTSPSRSVLPSLVVPYSLPVLGSPLFITIQTTTSFRGPALVTLRYTIMEYDPKIPLRFFAAQGTLKSPFRDITASAGRGSMYTTGYRSGFSEFVLALDLRFLSNVIDTKFTELDQALQSQASFIEPARANELRNYLSASRDAWRRRQVKKSLDYLGLFSQSVKAGASADQIPDTYNDPANPVGNVAGDLFARAQTTIFSLKLAL
jgi:hypothetical protein